MAQYICSICGYVYDEEKGIPAQGIAPGTRFSDLPQGWECPICHFGKEKFQGGKPSAPPAPSSPAAKHLPADVRVPIEPEDPSIVREESLCIKCGQCVKVCRERQSVAGHFSLEKTNNVGICIECGQCINYCPVNSLRERDSLAPVKEALADPRKVVFVQTSPSTRVGISEACGLPPGTFSEGKLVSALKRLGFSHVFDTNFAADLTIMEEASELALRLSTPGSSLPMFTSCCPAWVKFVETFFPERIPHLSTSRSPLLMSGPTLKLFYAKRLGFQPEQIFNVGVTPCTAKKFEILRPEFHAAGKQIGQPEMRDFNAILTVRELGKWLQQEGIDFASLPETPYDSLRGSGAGVIFANTGGVMEAALRTAHWLLTGQEAPKDFFALEAVRGMEGVKEATVTIAGKTIRACVAHTTANARKLLEDFPALQAKYDFVEVMTCLGGCIGGGGQPKCDNDLREQVVAQRTAAIYQRDAAMSLRESHNNPEIQELYREFYGKPLSHLAEELLHTSYASRANTLG